MFTRIKQYLWVVLALGVFYFFLIHHIIVFSFTDFELLKKAEPTLEYTFISLRQNRPIKVLRVDVLRNAGIEEIMLERGILSEKRLDQILESIDKEKMRREKSQKP